MTAIVINDFGGEFPSISPTELPMNGAQVSLNLLMSGKEFRPQLASVSAATTASILGGTVTAPTVLHRTTFFPSGSSNTNMGSGWIASAAADGNAHFVRGQINGDTTERTYYTGPSGPRKFALSGSSVIDRPMGVPAPTTAPTTVLTVVPQFTKATADEWIVNTFLPSLATTIRPFLTTTRVRNNLPFKGATVAPSVHGMTWTSTSENYLFTLSQSAAASLGIDDPALADSISGGVVTFSVPAAPWWYSVTNKAGLISALVAIKEPNTNTSVWTTAQATTVADFVEAHFNGDDSVRALRQQIDVALQEFKNAIALVPSGSTATLPTQPVPPSVPETQTVNGVTSRHPLWVTYDTAMNTYQQQLTTYLTEMQDVRVDRAARVSGMITARAKAANAVAQINAKADQAVVDLANVVRNFATTISPYKSSTNPNGIAVVDAPIMESRFYVCTYVTDWGEESAPSPVTDLIELDQNDTVAVTIPNPANASATGITKWRLYRTNTGGQATTFQFVTEGVIGSRTFTDDVKASELSEVCPSVTWAEPDSRMRGLCGMANGVVAGFFDNVLAFCEPYQPYAWPVEYQVTTEFPIVALASFGQSMFVGTRGNPYLVSGSDSASMSALKMESNQACVSARSVSAVEGGVIYASPDGLCLFSQGGVKLLTDGLFSREDWQALVPTSILGVAHDSAYYFICQNNTKAYVLSNGRLSQIDLRGTALYVDKSLDRLFYASGTSIFAEYSGTTRKNARWRSRVFTLPKQECFAWLKVYGQQTPSNPVTIRWFADGSTTPRYTVMIRDENPVRLPPGRWLEHEVEVEGSVVVTKVVLAGNSDELRGV